MCDDYRAMLDELFGKERNVPSQKRKNDAHFWDENVTNSSIHVKVCKNNLISICFNDLWKHTKYDSEGE